MKVNEKSWHYSFYRAGKLGPLEHWSSSKHVRDEGKSNICTYIRNMLLGLLIAFMEILFGLILAIIMLDPVLTLGFYIFTANGFIPFLTTGAVVLGGLIWLVILGVVLGYFKTQTKIGQAIKIPETVTITMKESNTLKLIKTYYKAFKEKTCILIEFEK